MIKLADKVTRRPTVVAFLTAAAVMMMTAVGCQDGNVLMREERDAKLVNRGGEAWGIVCAGPSSRGCESAAGRAIAFHGGENVGLADVYEIIGSSWKRPTKVQWATVRNILYITYGSGCVVRYSFVTSDDGLLTLRAENERAVCGADEAYYPTLGSSLAAYQKMSIPAYPITFDENLPGGSLSVTSAGVPVVSGARFTPGTVLTIAAAPDENHFLSTLTVNGVSIVNGAQYTVTDAVTIAAEFAAVPTYPVIFSASAGGTLSVVTSAGTSITSGASLPAGTELKITAIPDENRVLSTLTVNGNPVASGATVTVDGSMEIDAVFSIKVFPVTISASVGGALSVTSDGDAITNGQSVPPGTVLTIAATPYTGFDLTALVVNGAPFTSGATHTVSGAVAITAVFSNPAASAHPVTFTAGEGGALSVTPYGGTETIASGQSVPVGTVLTITATPDQNNVLRSFIVNGLPVTSEETTQRTVDGALVISATFAAPVTFAANPSGGGRLYVTSASGSIMSGANVSVGEALTITASPLAGYVLATLTVNDQPFSNGARHTVTGPTTVVATFRAHPTVTFTANPPGGGLLSVTSAGGPITSGAWVVPGTVLTVIASPNDNYELTSLTVNGSPFASGATHTVVDAVTVVATFVQGTQDAGRSIINGVPNTANMTPEERGRYDLYLELKNGSDGDKYEFGNSWMLDASDDTHMDYNGGKYAVSIVFRGNGQFWVVGIPLDNNGDVNYDIPAKYTEFGTYDAAGGNARIRIPAGRLVGEENEYSGTFEVPQGGGEMELRLDNGNGKRNRFVEMRCLIFEYDANFVSVLQGFDPSMW